MVATTYDKLKELTGRSPHTLAKSVRRLEQFDYLQVAKAHKQPNVYCWTGLVERLAEEVRVTGISCVAELHRNAGGCTAETSVLKTTV